MLVNTPHDCKTRYIPTKEMPSLLPLILRFYAHWGFPCELSSKLIDNDDEVYDPYNTRISRGIYILRKHDSIPPQN